MFSDVQVVETGDKGFNMLSQAITGQPAGARYQQTVPTDDYTQSTTAYAIPSGDGMTEPQATQVSPHMTASNAHGLSTAPVANSAAPGPGNHARDDGWSSIKDDEWGSF